VLADVIWRTFEKTGSPWYYLEYKNYEHTIEEMRENSEKKEMDKTG